MTVIFFFRIKSWSAGVVYMVKIEGWHYTPGAMFFLSFFFSLHVKESEGGCVSGMIVSLNRCKYAKAKLQNTD